MTERQHETEAQAVPDHKWTIVRCGLAGVLVVAAISFVNLLAAIPRLFTANWTWTELALFPLQVAVLGFFPGLVTGILLPLRRYGKLGHAIIGAGCANVYLLACFALFEFDGLMSARWETVLAYVVLASFGGAGMGVAIARDILREDPNIDYSDSLFGVPSLSQGWLGSRPREPGAGDPGPHDETPATQDPEH